MDSKRRAILLYCAVLLALIGVLVTQATTGDYANIACDPSRCDPQPAIRLLTHGHLKAALSVQPTMGPVSVVLRVPGYWLSERLHADLLWEYRITTFICLLPVLLVAIALSRRARRVAPPFLVLLVAAFVVNPATFFALDWGHPEEALAAALVIAAALACAGRRTLWAAGFLALAMLTKQWALLGLVPVASLAPAGSRVKVALVALLITAVGLAPLVAGNASAFRDATRQTLARESPVRLGSIWWPVAKGGYTSIKGDARRRLPDGVKGIARAIIAFVLLAVMVGGTWLARHRLESVLALLGLLFLLRCVLDPYDLDYYHVAFLMAFVAADAVASRERPWRALVALAAIAAFRQLLHVDGVPPEVVNGVYLTWALALVVAVSWSLVRGRAGAGTGTGTGRAQPSAAVP